MADFIFNIAKGRVAEFYNRVKNGDPATARFKVILLASTGLEPDAVLKDLDTLTALVAGTTNEATNTGYSRKIVAAADIAVFTPDDVNDRVDLDMPDQTWTLANDGTGAIGKAVVVYFPDTGGADSQAIPCTAHDFVISADGSAVTAIIAASGFYRAQ